MRNYFRYIVYLIVAIGFSGANAGSYEDFFAAVKRDDAWVVQGLLSKGFDADTPGPDGQTGLMLAIREPAPKAAAILIDWPRTKIDLRNKADETPLMIAALKGHVDLARRLIKRDADVNKPGWTPLHYAATGGHVEMMDLLLEHHAFIDAQSPNKTTPLMMAAMYGSAQAVKFLLQAGADVNMKNQLGMTAVDFALRADRKEAAEMIAQQSRRQRSGGRW
ncbi:MAG: ankyrin repeat domain-containing protein [Pseudomonadota bacterium]